MRIGILAADALLLGVLWRHRSNRPSLVYCGDDHDAKELTAGLIRDVGLDPPDAAPLRVVRYDSSTWATETT